jgi:hypothetical protein
MAQPALVPITYDDGDVSNLVCESVGVPDPGPNVIPLPYVALGIDPGIIDLQRLEFRVEALGPSVTGASVVSLAPDKTSVTIDYTQGGGDATLTRAVLNHTIIS